MTDSDFTSLEDSKIIVKEEGVFSHNFEADEGLSAGEAVYVSGAGDDFAQVKGTTGGTDSFVGIAMYDVDSGDRVAVAGTGSKVYGRASSALDVGSYVKPDSNGKWQSGSASIHCGIALTAAGSSNASFKILIK